MGHGIIDGRVALLALPLIGYGLWRLFDRLDRRDQQLLAEQDDSCSDQYLIDG